MTSNIFAPVTKLHLGSLASIDPSVSSDASNPDGMYVIGMDVQKLSKSDTVPMIAAACSDNSLRFYNRDKVDILGTMKGHAARITGVKFCNKNPNLCFTSSLDGTLRCWDIRTQGTAPPQIFTGYEGCSFTSFDVNCDDEVVCAGTELIEDDAYLMFWDIRSTNLLGAYKESHSDDITQVAFHPTKNDSLATGSTDGLVCVFDIGKNNEHEALITTLNSESTVQNIGWCGANNEYLYCLTDDFSLMVWDAVESSTLIKYTDVRESLKEDNCKIDYLVDCFYHSSLKSLMILGGTNEGELSLLSAGRDRLHAIHTLPGAHSGVVRCLHWDSQGDVLVTGGEDSILSVWRKTALDNALELSEDELVVVAATSITQIEMEPEKPPAEPKPRSQQNQPRPGKVGRQPMRQPMARKPYGRGGGGGRRGQFRR